MFSTRRIRLAAASVAVAVAAAGIGAGVATSASASAAKPASAARPAASAHHQPKISVARFDTPALSASSLDSPLPARKRSPAREAEGA